MKRGFASMCRCVQLCALCLTASALALLAVPPVPVGADTSGDPVVMAAGDIACDPTSAYFNGGNGTAGSCRQKYTAKLLAGANAVLDLGDNQYESGTLAQYLSSYDLSWGPYKPITYPAPGNHEYYTTGAPGYFAYFGDRAGPAGLGYYSFEIGAWHMISLDSSVSAAVGSPQYNWLQTDLQTHSNLCTAAYWHEPRYRAGNYTDLGKVKPLWDLLYLYKADLVLNGHQHNYQRFAPMTPSGTIDRVNGIREIIAGTGGKGHQSVVTTDPRVEAANGTTFGVLAVTLHATSFDWKFLPEAGKTYTDSGTTACH